MSLKEKIKVFIEKATSDKADADFELPRHIFLLESQISDTKPPIVTIIIDGDEGVGIDDCTQVSRKLGAYLENENPFGEEAYNLEVTSPGVDYGLRLFRQYPQHVGRRIEFKLKDGSQKIGKLQSIEGEELHITEEYDVKIGKKGVRRVKYKPATINFEDVTSAQVQISFK